MQEALLSQLKDIHLPDYGASMFPLALGWWLLLLLPLVLVVLFFVVKRVRRFSVRLYATLELKKIYAGKDSDMAKAAAISVLMKRVAIRKFGNAAVADLHGKKWSGFIKEHSSSRDEEAMDTIANAAYVVPGVSCACDMKRVYEAAALFIRKIT